MKHFRTWLLLQVRFSYVFLIYNEYQNTLTSYHKLEMIEICTTWTLMNFPKINDCRHVCMHASKFVIACNSVLRHNPGFVTHKPKYYTYRSSHPEVFLEKGVLKICSKFTGKHPCRSANSIKLQSNFIEIALRYGCSPVNLLHVFRTPLDGCFSFWNWFKVDPSLCFIC